MTRALTLLFSRSSSLFLFRSSLSLKGFPENSGKTADTNAMFRPSGDQTGWVASVEIVVSGRASPPSAAIT